ncbi:phosphotransferase family protein [Herbidospora cretacea]|uniref:phosphotransferase family protein n=1 Tax=Herbidospora cretacea TaxID=28444 RepID=UPI0004C4695A|nr:aminoglycoside phosphotransferase family protein [Herbidospora cretacea]
MTTLRPSTLAWVHRHLETGERILTTDPLHGGITADVRRLTVGTPHGGMRHLVLRAFVGVEQAEEWLNREAHALTLCAGSGVPAPELVAVDATAAHCAYPSLLMTHLPGRVVLADEGIETRVPLLARQLVAVHALRPAERPRDYVTLTTADTVVVPEGADAGAWAEAIDLIRRPPPPWEGRVVHRDFQPGNVLFTDARITGVVDWAATSWGPADLDVAHCCTNLALLHGPEWGLRFAAAYEEAGGVLAADPAERLYWQVRDGMACSEEVAVVSRPWREAGRTDLTTRVVEERLDVYVTTLIGSRA